MKINPLKTIVTENGVYPPGEIFEVDDKVAKELIEQQVAIPVQGASRDSKIKAYNSK